MKSALHVGFIKYGLGRHCMIQNQKSEYKTINLTELANINKSKIENAVELQAIFSDIANQVRSRLRTSVTSHNNEIKYVRFSNLLETLNQKCIVCVFDIFDWNTKGLLVYDQEFAQNTVELVLGGYIDQTQQSQFKYSESIKDLLEVEMRFVIRAFQERVSRTKFTSCEFSKVEQGLDAAYIFAKNAWVLAAPISITTNNNKVCSAHFVLTREAIEFALPVIRTESIDNVWCGHVHAQTSTTTVLTQVVVHESEVALKDVVSISIGDFLPIDNPYTGVLENRMYKAIFCKCRQNQQSRCCEH